jgi:predicted alpha/beta-hydrolase family hydrolase
MVDVEEFKLIAAPGKGEVSALWARPAQPTSVLVLGHGAGSTLGHPLMRASSEALSHVGVATLRFNYPYSERGRGMDAEAVRLATVRAAVLAAAARANGLPLFAGGHSMSGRMMSMAQAEAPLTDVRGIVFLAFPLHPGAPDAARAAHLSKVRLPMLFLSGTRDKLAEPTLLTRVVGELERATLHFIDTADHGFKVLKRRNTEEPPLEEVARVTREWMSRIAGPA